MTRRVAWCGCPTHTLGISTEIPIPGRADVSELHSQVDRHALRALALVGVVIAACARGNGVPAGAVGATDQRATLAAATPAVASRDTSCIAGERQSEALADTGAYRVTQRLAGQQVVECRIHDAWPPTRVVIVADTADQRITGLRVQLPPVAGRAVAFQQLETIGDEAPVRGMPYFFALDFDGDGYRELVAMALVGATGNTGYDVWRWDLASGRFAKDTVLSGLSNPRPVPGRPCVTSHSVGGMAGMIHSNGMLCRGGWGLGHALHRDAGLERRCTHLHPGDARAPWRFVDGGPHGHGTRHA